MVSLKHACFLRDPRTEVVVGEPRYDLDIIPLLATFLPQEIRKEVELPHKRAVFVSCNTFTISSSIQMFRRVRCLTGLIFLSSLRYHIATVCAAT